MEFKKVTNGRTKVANKKRSTRRKKRNATPKKAANSVARVRTTPVVANKRRAKKRRRNTTPAVVTAANPKRRKKTHRRRNGILGNSKETVTKVLSIGGGIVATQSLTGTVARFTNGYLNQFGLGAFAPAINNLLTAGGLYYVGKMLGKSVGLPELGGDLFLGGAVTAGINAANALAPNPLFSIFSVNTTQPVIVAQAGAAAALDQVAKTGSIAQAARNMGLMPNTSNVRPMMRMPAPNLNAAM